MQTQAQILKRAAALAAVANPANNASETEQATALAKLIKLCEAHGLNLADFAPFATAQAQPEPEPTEQPAPKTDIRAERRARVAAINAAIRVLYAGASPAYRRSGRVHSFTTYADTVTAPRQSIGPNGPSERDDSGLLGLLQNSDADGLFSPVNLCVDLGVISRLASVGFLASVGGERLAFTEAGLARANGAASRAAKA
jgi:hypothetical protein